MVNRRYGFLVGLNFTSSGALIDEGLLLTAAHNYASLRAPFSFVRNRSVECGVGVAPGADPWWRVDHSFTRGRDVRHPRQFRSYEWAFDYALVRLSGPAPQASSFQLPRPGDTLIARDSIVFIAGYPAVEPNTGSLLFHARARVVDLTETQIFYDLEDAEKGLSGAPVWVQRGREFILVGIHVGESNGRITAHRISDATLQNLSMWMAEFQRDAVP